LAEKANFLETAYLLLFGELPTSKELNGFSRKVMDHTFVHHDVFSMM
jgi:citrate synthase